MGFNSLGEWNSLSSTTRKEDLLTKSNFFEITDFCPTFIFFALEVHCICASRSISYEVSSLTVDREEVGTIWLKEVIVTATIDDIDFL